MGQHTKKQLQWGIILGVVTFFLMVISYNVGLDKGKESAQESDTAQEDILAEQVEINPKEVSIHILSDCEAFVSSKADVREYCVEFEENSTALTVMQTLDEQNDDFSFTYKESDFGAFLTGINEYQADADTEFWSFLVNDEMSVVGVSDYTVVNEDVLGFIVEKIEM